MMLFRQHFGIPAARFGDAVLRLSQVLDGLDSVKHRFSGIHLVAQGGQLIVECSMEDTDVDRAERDAEALREVILTMCRGQEGLLALHERQCEFVLD